MPLELASWVERPGTGAVLAVGGAVIGALFGFFAQRSRFCLRAAVIEFWHGKFAEKLSVWLLAFASAINALQALMDGFDVVTVEQAIADADIVITSTGNLGIITLAHMRQMKHQAILGNIGHFDNEIDMAGLEGSGAKRINIKPQVDQWIFDDGKSIIVLSEGRLLNLGNATGHPSFVMSNSFSNQVIAQIELWTKNDEYDNEVYRLPKHLDEKVARIHVEALGGTLTRLTKEQAEYINVDVEGPYKPEHYRY